MKTKSILAVLCTVCTLSLFSQSISIGIAGGYNAPVASSFSALDEHELQIATPPYYYATYEKVIRKSYGQGGNIAFDFNWFSKKDIGLGLKLNAHIGSPFSSTADVIYLNGPEAHYNFQDKPFSFQFIPHLSFKHDFKKITPVFEMGMIIGATHVTQNYSVLYSTGDMLQSTINRHGGIMLGFYSSLGLEFHVSRVVRISLAVTATAASYSPTKWDRTSATANGQNQMPYLNTSQLHGEYVKELNPQAPQSASSPSQGLKYAIPFSNVGFNVGIAFVFVKKKTRIAQQATDKDKDNTKALHPF